MKSFRWVLFALGFLFVRSAALAEGPGSIAEQYLFQAANAERLQRGLPQLRWDETLYHAAQAHAREMAMRESISHQYAGELDLGARGKLAGTRFSTISENVAEAPTAVIIHDAWMNSPGHRANLLDARVDSIAISVLRRDGQLYAVEDFVHSVRNLSLDEQEQQVAALVTRVVPVEILPTSEGARQTCAMSTGYAGRTPGFVMRFTAGDLNRLPETLTSRLRSGQYRKASVAACDSDERKFTSFHIAVLLYP